MTSRQQLSEDLSKRLLALAKMRNRKIRVYATKNKGERMRLEINRNPYLIFFPGTGLELTPGRIAQRVKSWPRIRGKPVTGYVILATNADLSSTTAATDGQQLPPRVAVVGLWGTKDRFVASDIDPGIALILEAANVPRGEIRRVMNREEVVSAQVHPPPQEAPAPAPEAQWGRSPRKGMLLDAYLLERRLGRGHSAEVWKAQLVRRVPGVELEIGATVALKIYLPALLHGFEALRIQREFSIAAELEHPNLARVFDLVLSPSRPFHTFMVMEYIEGPTLKDYIGRKGPLSAPETLAIARQLFTALAELHSLGAVHRDVKAANIMVASQAATPVVVKLVDLGIVAVAAEEKFTVASAFLGSKHSAPLEQLIGGALDERTDIYGAGSVLFHCIKGTPMYSGVGPEGAIVRQMLSAPEQLSTGLEGEISLDASLKGFVNMCIRVDARERPSTAQGCLDLLNRTTPIFVTQDKRPDTSSPWPGSQS